MKTATITFHASHNYGSMLQAFALQSVIKGLGFENEIINLRTQRQKNVYDYDKKFRYGGRNLLKKILYAIVKAYYASVHVQRHALFERFLHDNLTLTREFATGEELYAIGSEYDCYISGGDQIWNTAPLDFDWSFYLPFVSKGKRISYGVSMGPKAEKEVSELDKIGNYLKQYNHIAVREQGTKNMVERLVSHPVEMVLDPVLLLSADEWKKHYEQKPIIQGDYILVYVPYYNKEVYELAARIGNRMRVKVVNTIFHPAMIRHPHIHGHYATGPWEFLNLLQHSRLVVSGSFHATIFSMLYNKPFVAVNGVKDNRMYTMLEKAGFLSRSISLDEVDKWNNTNLLHCDFSQADVYITEQRKASIDYLKHSIEN